jgi:dipeptidyl aminopeptidase/acylaminoacyl peptidase
MKTQTLLAAGLLLMPCTVSIVHADAPHGVPSAGSAVRRLLTADDLDLVQSLSDPQVSPEGSWVAYVVTTNDRDADEARSAIWMVSWDGSQRVPLTTAASDTEKPRWSPDGRYLAFLTAATGSDKPQLMLLDRRGGDARPVTSVHGDISDYAWSSDGKRLVLVMEQSDDPAKSSAAVDEKIPKPIVIDALHFKEDKDGYLSAGHGRHLYLVDVDAKRVEALTTDAQFNEDLPAWSPDGERIAFIRTRDKGPDQDGRTDIDVIDARVGAVARTVVRPYAPNEQHIAWSPDGKLIAYLQGLQPKLNAYMQDHLYVVPAAGGVPRALTDKLDRAVMSYAFAGDSSAITIAVEDDRTIYPAHVDVASGIIHSDASPGSDASSGSDTSFRHQPGVGHQTSQGRQIPSGPFVVSSLSSSAGHTALLKTDDAAFDEVYALEAGHLRKLTAHNDALLAGLQLGAVEDIQFKSKDGADVRGVIVKPPSFVSGRKYPTILWIHGGPNGQDEHSLVLDGYQLEPQWLAAKGYVVLRVNYRGGSGRGAAFAQAILGDWGHKEVEDLLAGVDYLVAQGIADPARLGVGGWSYGGILTDYTIASDRRFKAAVSGAGSANQLSTYGSDEYVLQYNAELGPPWSNTALWLKLSYPFFHADRIHTPTLFMGGDKDFNVPIVGGEQMYQALRTLGVPAQLVVYPGEHHIFTRPSFVRDLAERVAGWYGRYLGPILPSSGDK